MDSIPKPYLVLWLALSMLLNILGIASIVDGAVTWLGFVAELIATYRKFLREPLLFVAELFWPASWPRIPRWTADVLIVQSSFFISYRLFMDFEKRRYLIVFREAKILQPVLVFLFGPVVPFFQLLRLRRKGHYEARLARSEAREGQNAERQYTQYGDTNLPLLSEEGWIALDKRQLAGLEAQAAAKSTFFKLNLYYLCYIAAIIVVLFIAYQFGHQK
jgi:hypothetical protein